MNLVTLDRIDKQFSERPLFEGASLLINLGDRIGLIGVNGSGKTTLLKLIAGSEPPDRGALTVTGGVRIEYLAQEPPLDDKPDGARNHLPQPVAADAPAGGL
jgi:ATP-binding cassette subfamily F protein uup